jgi:outer membrane protein with beta-barrel domain
MKKLTMLMLLTAMISLPLHAQNQNDSAKKESYNYYMKMRDSLMKAYTDQNKELEDRMNGENENRHGLGSNLFSLKLDVIFGVGFSSTQFDLNTDTSGLSNTESKKGPMVGANVTFGLLGFYLTTGFSYSSRGFKTSNSSNEFSANYFNIPLMFSYNFNIKKVEIDLSAGPYIGIRLSQDTSSVYQFKNIDIGIAGSLQGSYFFNRFMGAMVGVKYEHGGLNNLLETTGQNNISSIKTRNLFIYSGVKFVL